MRCQLCLEPYKDRFPICAGQTDPCVPRGRNLCRGYAEGPAGLRAALASNARLKAGCSSGPLPGAHGVCALEPDTEMLYKPY